MRKIPEIRGLYAITPDLADTGLLLQQVAEAIKGGARLVQYRNKIADDALKLEQGTALLDLCHNYGVPLIINDHVELCRQLDADGIHLGSTDSYIENVRALLGKNKIIGASCYNRFELAIHAKTQGADYIAFGTCFDSATKPAAVRAPLELFLQAKREIGLPMVAIGGINIDNADNAIAAGADAIAVIHALFAAPDIQQTAQTFTNLFKHTTRS